MQKVSMIVDLRPGRIGSACARQIDPADGEAFSAPPAGTAEESAEIILFPKVHRARTGRPRKRLTRRFAAKARAASDLAGKES
jgi:hypothetical protein